MRLSFPSFRISLLVFITGVMLSTQVKSQITLTPFITNATAVTDITHCNDDRLFIVEQAGVIKISDLQGNLNPVPFLNITTGVASGGERGLLGLAFSPKYQLDGRFYVNYTNLLGNTVIARFNVDAVNPDIADTSSQEILFTVTQPFSNHNGGAMFFGKDGYLYISLGDGGSGGDPGDRAQNLLEDLGKLHRINVDVPSGYSIPGSNPFYGSSSANQKIWAYGLRNAWRVNKDRLTGDIWVADVGQGLWEEINYQPYSSQGGENYGWRCYEGNASYNLVGCQPPTAYDFPVYVYDHSIGCSVTGGFVYRGAQHSSLFGKYFFTDYCDGIIKSLTPDGSGGFTPAQTAPFDPFVYSTFGEDKYGELYIGKISTGVLKMSAAGCSPVAFISSQDTITHCGSSYTFSTPQGQGFLYQWFLNGTVITGADSSSYTATQSGNYYVQSVNSNFCSAYSDTVYLDIISAPAVSFTGLPSLVCINAAVVTLSGIPAGGVFSGSGIVNSTFDASAAGIGTHIITYTYDNGNGCIIPSTGTIVVDACLSSPEIPAGNEFIVSPNPASDYTEIMWSSAMNDVKYLDVLDIKGRSLLKIQTPGTMLNYRLQTNELSSGVYVIRMTTGGKTIHRKLVVK